jgi:hypothetical protein
VLPTYQDFIERLEAVYDPEAEERLSRKESRRRRLLLRNLRASADSNADAAGGLAAGAPGGSGSSRPGAPERKTRLERAEAAVDDARDAGAPAISKKWGALQVRCAS